MADKNKTPTEMARPGLGSLAKKKNKTLKEKEFENYKTALDTKYDKMSRIQKTYEGASPKIKADLKNKFKKLSDSFGSSEMISSANRETGRTEKAKGGRAGYKGGKSVKKKGGAAIRGRSKILR